MTRVDVAAKAIHGFCKHTGAHGWTVHRDEAKAALEAINVDSMDRAKRSLALDAERRKTAAAIAEHRASDARHQRAVAHAKHYQRQADQYLVTINRLEEELELLRIGQLHTARALQESTPDLFAQAGGNTDN